MKSNKLRIMSLQLRSKLIVRNLDFKKFYSNKGKFPSSLINLLLLKNYHMAIYEMFLPEIPDLNLILRKQSGESRMPNTWPHFLKGVNIVKTRKEGKFYTGYQLKGGNSQVQLVNFKWIQNWRIF